MNKKTIIWRFDDLCFNKTGEYYIPISKLKEIADIFYKNKQSANFALIIDNNVFEKEARLCINYLIKQEHAILAHGAPHCNWQKLNENEIKTAVLKMRNNLDKLGIKTNIFVFPGLKANPSAYKWLKKYGFNVIIKGDRLKKISRLVDWIYSKIYNLSFIYQDVSTNDKNWNLKPIHDFYELINCNKNTVHVMDHLWLYKKNSLKEFEKFVGETSQSLDFITIENFD